MYDHDHKIPCLVSDAPVSLFQVDTKFKSCVEKENFNTCLVYKWKL
jgi:hypothetical protein